MTTVPTRAAALARLTVGLAAALGGAACGLGWTEGPWAAWGFGAACLLQTPSALNVIWRLREGLGNQGLERERLIHRGLGIALRLLALGLALGAASDLAHETARRTTDLQLGLQAAAFPLAAALALAKRGLREVHPTLGLDGDRARVLAELAALFLAGGLLGRWFPWADAATALVLALRLFMEGQTLARGTTLPVACGGCGSGCGCG
ncbi:MAG: hypothetical protein H6P99_831 [Holophagaceae bacterium]|nr:hypothetical protein [Holophagaceae bacterium]